jgi:RimJ/RimL family protein N-acetyltransferase
MIAIPVVETERLVLRGHRRDDLADCVGMWGDPEVTRHIGGRPSTDEEVWARLLRYLGHWQVMGFGYWIVHERASGRFVGEVGFADSDRHKLEAVCRLP